mmetsp:Transcript_3039/g.3208  ORF Transcript_3039/g.3208 Transcript_3039/m.3208 type:complete len:266 (-) Transcript_3039:47-844(-)|eukprot:CAMPEP_0182417608 /NCGR_PEP_ID=MMETSP1167-20130531/2067_1 /TAXON_ID=2988 /ORGANISM="Mallomonas Sp, Strain CCMP3275" /LENGTH=265 /DNA_ID=CAMNT_0024591289 /DNA_START=156 /DNA_END=953 /DNA_ORIENTATION=-
MKRTSLHSLLLRRSFGRQYRKLKDNRPIIQKQRTRNADLELEAEKSGLGWRIVSASILHRYPVITADVEQWESDMWEVQDKIQSKQREWLMERIGGTDTQFIPEHYPDPEEIISSLPFTPASRITEADLNDDRRSLERSLSRSVFLIVKRNRENYSWQFPQGKIGDSETLRESAERVLDRAVGNVRRYFLSNSPMGYMCYKYPDSIQRQRNQFGAKVFYYRAQLIEGDIRLETRLYTDYAWVTREEVEEYLDKDSAEFMTELLLD